MNTQKLVRGAALIVTAAATVLGFQAVAHASGAPSTVYVSNHGNGSSYACNHAGATSIQQGVDQVAAGGRVIVCQGTYRESVNITKRLTLQGQHGAVVDATGQSYGIGIGADHVTVTGMTVHNAGKGLVKPEDAQADCGTGPTAPRCAGITTFAAAGGPPVIGNYATIVGNVLVHNIGFGLDIVSTHDSLIKDNKANINGAVGMNVVDDLGQPVMNNKIIDNETSFNISGCGIALASHVGPGVIGNWVQGNTATRNGRQAGGAGILLATPIPNGVVKDNTLTGNALYANGHSGVEVHIHNNGPDVSGNQILGNTVGTNNRLGDFGDADTTGIYIGSNTPMSIVVKDNHISKDVNGIFAAGPNVQVVRSGNTFWRVGHDFVSINTFA